MQQEITNKCKQTADRKKRINLMETLKPSIHFKQNNHLSARQAIDSQLFLSVLFEEEKKQQQQHAATKKAAE